MLTKRLATSFNDLKTLALASLLRGSDRRVEPFQVQPSPTQRSSYIISDIMRSSVVSVSGDDKFCHEYHSLVK